MIVEARPFGEGEAAGALDTSGIGGVVEKDAALFEVAFNKINELGGQKVRSVGAKVERGVGHDGIEAPAGIGAQPTAAIVDNDRNLGVGQKRSDLRLIADEREIAGIDLNDSERRDLRIVGDDLRPRARRQTDQQHVTRRRVEQTERIRPHDAVGVMLEIGIEAAVIHAVAEDHAVGRHRDDAAAILDDMDEGLGIGRALPLQLLKYVDRPVRDRDQSQNGKPRGHARLQHFLRARRWQHAVERQGTRETCNRQRRRHPDNAEMIGQNKTGEDRARCRTENVGQIEQRRPHAGAIVGGDAELGEMRQKRTPETGEQIDQHKRHADDAAVEPSQRGEQRQEADADQACPHQIGGRAPQCASSRHGRAIAASSSGTRSESERKAPNVVAKAVALEPVA